MTFLLPSSYSTSSQAYSWSSRSFRPRYNSSSLRTLASLARAPASSSSASCVVVTISVRQFRQAQPEGRGVSVAFVPGLDSLRSAGVLKAVQPVERDLPLVRNCAFRLAQVACDGAKLHFGKGVAVAHSPFELMKPMPHHDFADRPGRDLQRLRNENFAMAFAEQFDNGFLLCSSQNKRTIRSQACSVLHLPHAIRTELHRCRDFFLEITFATFTRASENFLALCVGEFAVFHFPISPTPREPCHTGARFLPSAPR